MHHGPEYVITDRVSMGDSDVITSVHLSVLFHSNFCTEPPLTLIFCVCMGHDYTSPGTECQGQR